MILVNETYHSLFHGLRVIEDAFKLSGIEGDNEDGIVMYPLDVVNTLEVILVAGFPAITGFLTGDHTAEVSVYLVTEKCYCTV